MELRVTEIILAIIALIGTIIGGAGLWNYLSFRAKLKIQEKKDDISEASRNTIEDLVATQIKLQSSGTSSAIDAMKQSVDFLQNRVSEMDKAYNALNRQYAVLRVQFEDCKQLLHGKLTEVASLTISFKSTIESQSESLLTIQEIVKKRDLEIVDLNSEVKDLKSEIIELKNILKEKIK